MRLTGKLVNWNNEKAFGFIAPNGGGNQVFIHKTGFSNRKRIPQVNDVITFSVIKDKQGRFCADDAIYAGEKRVIKQDKKLNMFSVMLSTTFLGLLAIAAIIEHLPKNLVMGYFAMSIITFIAYALDKSKARRGAWRTPESTLHSLALAGGWPGAIIAQQALRHKSKKVAFKVVLWLTVAINILILTWLLSSQGTDFISIFQ